MLYRVGTAGEIPPITHIFPPAIIQHLSTCIVTLDQAYGEKRNYMESGGYSLLAESAGDVHQMAAVVNLDTHPCEWVDLLHGEEDYLAALFLLNDDFSIVTYLPVDAAPETLRNEMEEF